MFAKHTHNKELIPRIDEEPLHLNNKNKQPDSNMGKGLEKTFL